MALDTHQGPLLTHDLDVYYGHQDGLPSDLDASDRAHIDAARAVLHGDVSFQPQLNPSGKLIGGVVLQTPDDSKTITEDAWNFAARKAAGIGFDLAHGGDELDVLTEQVLIGLFTGWQMHRSGSMYGSVSGLGAVKR